eukprot:TRINITY_DN1473_c0_g2_i1.p1 TRINITY_DN1473_c0_g2~~TRINITY_DN1473_c0_g2_i1.p1  ORF type:complete len:238 (-),score=27.67 TRINITY_DN1473_c0_g2_i1:206-919(-)
MKRKQVIDHSEFENGIKGKKPITTNSPRQAKSEKMTNPHSLHEHQHNDSSETHGEDVRVGASSKVNFTKLSPEEQRFRYISQLYRIQKLKTQLKSYIQAKGKRVHQSLKKTHERLQRSKHDREGQKLALNDLFEGIITGRLAPNTLGYNQICTILRDVLEISGERNHHELRLQEKSIPISTLEYTAYKEMLLGQEELRAVVGRLQGEETEKKIGTELIDLNIQMLNEVIKSGKYAIL